MYIYIYICIYIYIYICRYTHIYMSYTHMGGVQAMGGLEAVGTNPPSRCAQAARIVSQFAREANKVVTLKLHVTQTKKYT